MTRAKKLFVVTVTNFLKQFLDVESDYLPAFKRCLNLL